MAEMVHESKPARFTHRAPEKPRERMARLSSDRASQLPAQFSSGTPREPVGVLPRWATLSEDEEARERSEAWSAAPALSQREKLMLVLGVPLALGCAGFLMWFLFSLVG